MTAERSRDIQHADSAETWSTWSTRCQNSRAPAPLGAVRCHGTCSMDVSTPPELNRPRALLMSACSRVAGFDGDLSEGTAVR